MKEDILEQLVEDYFQREGYLTIHNVKFRPRREHRDFKTRKDSSHSDIDILGYNPHKRGTNRVVAVSCKSWQSGFRAEWCIQKIEDELKKLREGEKIPGGKQWWKYFRELTVDKWSKAFNDKIEEITGTNKFTYYLAVTRLKGDQEKGAKAWQEHKRFKKALRGNPIKILTVQEILDKLWASTETTIAESEIGRLLQVVKASGWETNMRENSDKITIRHKT